MHLKSNLKSTECTYYLKINKSKFLNKKQLLVHFVPCHHLIYVNVSSNLQNVPKYYLNINKSKFLNKKQLLVHFVPCHHLIYVNVSSLKILEQRAYVSLLSFSSNQNLQPLLESPTLRFKCE